MTVRGGSSSARERRSCSAARRARTRGRISGGVDAVDAASVQIPFATINGGLHIQGGSGPFGGPFDITWNAIEDNRINGAVTISGYDGFWMGFIRNHVDGSVNLNDNFLMDPDGNEYVTNVIHGSLTATEIRPLRRSVTRGEPQRRHRRQDGPVRRALAVRGGEGVGPPRRHGPATPSA